jgi:hypothetical protein
MQRYVCKMDGLECEECVINLIKELNFTGRDLCKEELEIVEEEK